MYLLVGAGFQMIYVNIQRIRSIDNDILLVRNNNWGYSFNTFSWSVWELYTLITNGSQVFAYL